MTERLPLTTERVDDIPLWLAQVERMGLQPLLDKHFATHGTGVGLSLGWVRVLWLTPSLSEADPRLTHVTPWAVHRLHTRRVYDLQPACGRQDRTTANGHWTVTEDGLFQFGHRKDQRPDLAQVQIMVSALAPLGLPVATDVVPGQRADAPLYSLAIRRGRL